MLTLTVSYCILNSLIWTRRAQHLATCLPGFRTEEEEELYFEIYAFKVPIIFRFIHLLSFFTKPTAPPHSLPLGPGSASRAVRSPAAADPSPTSGAARAVSDPAGGAGGWRDWVPLDCWTRRRKALWDWPRTRWPAAADPPRRPRQRQDSGPAAPASSSSFSAVPCEQDRISRLHTVPAPCAATNMSVLE